MEQVNLREVDDLVASPAEHGFKHEETKTFHLIERDRRWHGEFLTRDVDFDERGAVVGKCTSRFFIDASCSVFRRRP